MTSQNPPSTTSICARCNAGNGPMERSCWRCLQPIRVNRTDLAHGTASSVSGPSMSVHRGTRGVVIGHPVAGTRRDRRLGLTYMKVSLAAICIVEARALLSAAWLLILIGLLLLFALGHFVGRGPALGVGAGAAFGLVRIIGRIFHTESVQRGTQRFRIRAGDRQRELVTDDSTPVSLGDDISFRAIRMNGVRRVYWMMNHSTGDRKWGGWLIRDALGLGFVLTTAILVIAR